MSINLKDDILNAVRESKVDKTFGPKTPKFRKPTAPPQLKPPAQINPNYTPPASEKSTCTYETPCGWCTKWDNKCDKTIGRDCRHISDFGVWNNIEDTDKWPSNPKTRVLCCKGNGIPFVGRQFYKVNGKFYCRTTKNNTKPLSHWCYLPKQPKGEII